ncbi:MAG: FkbM family methyltransferase [Desulfuromonadaceae bacterium]|nr:FkbM family methyltransferase [Desulfuromonadaceae bacterium]MDD2854109.1 FkbM family methyltransferase [Desulfuromonadaceae bacterium]
MSKKNYFKTILGSIFGRPSVKLDPHNVNYQEALSFFKNKHEQYKKSVSVLSKFVTPEDDFIDVGANIGYFSLEYMSRIGFKGRGYLFEPVSNLARLCDTTFMELHFDVMINNFALGDMNGTTIIYTAADGNIGWNTVVEGKISSGMKGTEIETRRFDSLNIELDTVGAIKIDVEGGEYQVLSGMLPVLERSTRLPVLLIEVGWGQNHPFWDMELKVLNLIMDLGYTSLVPGGSKIDIDSISETMDVLFVPDRLIHLCSTR